MPSALHHTVNHVIVGGTRIRILPSPPHFLRAVQGDTLVQQTLHIGTLQLTFYLSSTRWKVTLPASKMLSYQPYLIPFVAGTAKSHKPMVLQRRIESRCGLQLDELHVTLVLADGLEPLPSLRA